MEKIRMVFKSGKEYNFLCKSYTIEKFSLSGELCRFSFEGGVGECPIFFKVSDIESIGIDIGWKEEFNERSK